MSYNERSLLRKIFSTAHRILLERVLDNVFPGIHGSVLVVGAGKEPYRRLLCSASHVVLTDITGSSDDIDQIVDVHCMPFDDSSFDVIFAIEVFEHLESPSSAASEIYRVLGSGGLVFLSIPFMFHIHGDPFDFQRFTSHGIKFLFRDFQDIQITPFGSRFHVVSDILSTSSKLSAVFRPVNWFLTLPFFSSVSQDCCSGYFVTLSKI